jgi:chorismate mutase-like protein
MSESSTPAASPELASLRERIDELDRQLVDVLARRLDICHEVARLKEKSDTPIIQPQRVRDVLTGRRQWAIDRGIDPDFIEDVMRVVLAETHRIEVAGRRNDAAPEKLAASNKTRSHIDAAMDTVTTRIDHVVVAVEDVNRAVEEFTSRFGFHRVTATSQDGTRDDVPNSDELDHDDISVIAAGGVTLVLVGPSAGPDVAAHLAEHGSGIHHIALEVLNAGYARSILLEPGSPVTNLVVDEQGHEQFFTVRDQTSGVQLGFIARTGHRDGVATRNVLEAFRSESSPD